MNPNSRYPWPSEQILEWHKDGKTPYEIAGLLAQDSWQNSLWIPKLNRSYTPSAPAVRNELIRLGCILHKGRRYGAETRKWKGGRKIGKGGYVLLLRKDHPHHDSQGYVPEHRLVAEQMLRRYLSKKEVVHHIDGDRQNNSPENLEVFANNGDHVSTTIPFETRSQASYKGLANSTADRREIARKAVSKQVRGKDGRFQKQIKPCAPKTRKTPVRLKELLSTDSASESFSKTA